MSDAKYLMKLDYSNLQDVSVIGPNGNKGHKHCIKLETRDFYVMLLQVC